MKCFGLISFSFTNFFSTTDTFSLILASKLISSFKAHKFKLIESSRWKYLHSLQLHNLIWKLLCQHSKKPLIAWLTILLIHIRPYHPLSFLSEWTISNTSLSVSFGTTPRFEIITNFALTLSLEILCLIFISSMFDSNHSFASLTISSYLTIFFVWHRIMCFLFTFFDVKGAKTYFSFLPLANFSGLITVSFHGIVTSIKLSFSSDFSPFFSLL
jgi:hypothetical protein